MDENPYRAISLGHTCETKFQIARCLNAHGHPGRSQMAFRLEMAPPGRGARFFGWDIFDWIGVSLETVCDFLERDFRGVFERQDLAIERDGVFHRVLGTNHVHDFERLAEGAAGITEAKLDAAHPAQRATFERRAEAFRQQLTQPGPFLYIHQCEAFPEPAMAARLIAALSARSADHRFHILLMGYPDLDQDLSAFDCVSKAERARVDDKPLGRGWEGNDAAWDAALAPFDIVAPAGLEAAAAIAAAPEPPARQGLLGRMLARRLKPA